MVRTGNSSFIVVGMLASVTLTGIATAQTAWNGGGTADWYTGLNWTAGVPNQTLNTQVNGLPIAIVGGGIAETLDLSIAAAGAVQVNSGATLRIYGPSLVNNSTLTIFPHNTSGFDAYLEFRNAATTISGTGTIVIGPVSPIAGQDAGIVTNVATNIVTQGAGHTIRGNGYITASMNNAGTITGDISGRGIGFGSIAQSNSGLIVAQNGAYVHFDGATLTQSPSGIFRATGAGSFAQGFGSIIGGTWEGVSGGLARTAGNLTLDSVTTNGDVHVISGNHITVANALTNTGTITVNPSGGASDATISFNSPAITLTGGGMIVLCPTGGTFAQDAGINTSAAANVVTNPADATIRGNGYINANIDNAGLITCDLSGKGLSFVTNPKSNSGEIVAQNGGVVGSNVTITQTGSGVIRATGAGSITQFGPGAIVGGTWEGVSGGIAQTVGNTTLNGVTTNGTVNVASGTHISVVNSLTNTATLTVNPSGGSNDATISFDSPAITLAGGGTISLCPIGGGFAQDAGINSNNAANVVTNPSGATIRGNGYINANVNNAGLITCDLPGKGLSLVTNPKSNSGQIIAQNGGQVGANVNITQTGSGVIRAIGAGSIVQHGPGSIIGGTWEGVSGGIARTVGLVDLNGVTLNGSVHIQSGNTILVNNGLNNNSELTVNPSGGSNNASLTIQAPGQTISGTGSIVLNGVGSTNDANIFSAAGVTFTCGPDQTIAGRGQIIANTILQGTISPGTAAVPVNRIEHTSQTLTMTPSAALAVDINGLTAGQFDVLACTGTGVVLDGTLEVTVGVGFIPALGDEFVIMTHGPRTGTFEQIVTPNPGPNNAWRVRYEATRTVLTVTCPPDVNGDHSVSLDDLTQLLGNFGIQSGAQGFQGDLDGDGDVDISDLAALLATFGSTCP